MRRVICGRKNQEFTKEKDSLFLFFLSYLQNAWIDFILVAWSWFIPNNTCIQQYLAVRPLAAGQVSSLPGARIEK